MAFKANREWACLTHLQNGLPISRANVAYAEVTVQSLKVILKGWSN